MGSFNDALLLTAGYSKIEVTNLTTESDGGRFSFIGNDDLDVAPGAFFGSALGGQVFLNGRDARRAGIPENIYSATATYDFFNGLTMRGSVVRADAVDSASPGPSAFRATPSSTSGRPTRLATGTSRG